MSEKIKTDYFFILLILLMCSKFYYLIGFSDWPRPDAPLPFILVRDFLCILTLGSFIWVSRRNLFDSQLKFFWFIWIFGFLISVWHLFVIKSFAVWGQHYFRNVLLPMLFFPAAYGFFKTGRKLPIRKILTVLFFVNLAVSCIQLAIFRDLLWGGTRPTGLFGDPLINSMFLLLGWIGAVSSLTILWGAIFSLITLILLHFTSSLSAIGSFVIGILISIFLSADLRSHIKKRIKWVWGFAVIFLVSIFISYYIMKLGRGNSEDWLLKKTGLLINSLICDGPQCKNHWSYTGRIISNLRPFELCEQSWSACLMGDFLNSDYFRIDATWASLVMNWGAIFMLGFMFWMVNPLKKIWVYNLKSAKIDWDWQIWNLIFISCLTYSFFNAIFYKFPLNILLYLSMAAVMRESDR